MAALSRLQVELAWRFNLDLDSAKSIALNALRRRDVCGLFIREQFDECRPPRIVVAAFRQKLSVKLQILPMHVIVHVHFTGHRPASG